MRSGSAASVATRSDRMVSTDRLRCACCSVEPIGSTARSSPAAWSRDGLEIEPRLAETWKAVDPTTWEFKLRRGVKFHDGSDFTAEDVKFSIARMATPMGPNPTTIYVRRVKETKIVDPHTIQVITDGPAPNLPNDFIRLFVVSHTAAAGLTKENANE